MVEIHQPTAVELAEIEARIAQFPEKRRDNHRFLALYGYEDPVVCRVYPTWKRLASGKLKQVGERRLPLRRRQFMEGFLRIRNTKAKIVPLRLKPAQRMIECATLKLERQGLPVRIIILKARKEGVSTHVEGMLMERAVRVPNSSSIVVAHDEDSSRKILKMAHTMRDFMPKTARDTYRFDLKHEATAMLAWEDPIRSELQVASAKKSDPARGFTPDSEHLSEMAFWVDAEQKMQSLYNALPNTANTYCYIESTANGDTGPFRNRFWRAWNQRGYAVRDRAIGEELWTALFFAWYDDPDYRWSETYGDGRQLTDEQYLAIHNSLTKEEEWLLTQRYMRRWKSSDPWQRVDFTDAAGRAAVKWRRRGVGLRFVDYDQLAWRRQKIRDSGGDPVDPDTWDAFNAEYPARPEQAFLATGQVAFNTGAIHELLKLTQKPQFIGDLVDTTSTPDALEFTEATIGLPPLEGDEIETKIGAEHILRRQGAGAIRED